MQKDKIKENNTEEKNKSREYKFIVTHEDKNNNKKQELNDIKKETFNEIISNEGEDINTTQKLDNNEQNTQINNNCNENKNEIYPFLSKKNRIIIDCKII